MKFTVPGSPVPAPRMTRPGVHAKTHPKRAQIDAYLAHKDHIGWHARLAGVERIAKPGAVGMRTVYYLPDARPRDLKNLLATSEDALNGIAYDDDSQVVTHEMSKYIDRANPRTEIEIYPLPRWVMEPGS